MRKSDQFRVKALKHLSSIKSFKGSWPVWEPLLKDAIDYTNKPQSVFDLGNELTRIFKANSKSDRSQSSVASGGAAWECWVMWYLNLIFWNTSIIATRQNKRFVPITINDALAVTLGNHTTNTESDIVVYRIPKDNELKEISLEAIDQQIRNHISECDVSVVQCKTNWNDNAQIPMLWDLIYNARDFKIPNVYVGSKGYSPSSFKRFSYAFVTVPSQKVEKQPKPDSVAALRVKNLTGGNYWGQPNVPGVASNISEFFTRNFPSDFDGGVVNHLKQLMAENPQHLQAFTELNFDWPKSQRQA